MRFMRDDVQPRMASGSRLFEERWLAPQIGATVLSGSDAFTLHDTYGFRSRNSRWGSGEPGLQMEQSGS